MLIRGRDSSSVMDRRAPGLGLTRCPGSATPSTPGLGKGCPVVALLVMIVAAVPRAAPAEFIGDRELLKLVADGYTANIRKIQTWQGKATYDSSYRKPGKGIDRQHEVEFLCDVGAASLRWYWTQRYGKATGEEPAIESPHFTSGIAKGQVVYRLYPVPISPDRSPGNVYIEYDSSINEVKAEQDEFNPMYCFRCVEANMSRLLMFYHNPANEFKDPVRVERKANTVVLEVSGPGVVNRYEFDLSKGCNLAKYTEISNVTAIWSFAYEQLDDVFVPKKLTHDYTDPALSRHLVSNITFTESILNEPVDPNEFVLDKLRLLPGDYVQDLRTGAKYRYRFPPPPDIAEPPAFVAKSRVGDHNAPVAGAEKEGRTGPVDANEKPAISPQKQSSDTGARSGSPSSILPVVLAISAALLLLSALVAGRLARRHIGRINR